MSHPPLEVSIDEIVADDPALDRATLQRAIESALAAIEPSHSVSPSQSGIVRLSTSAGAEAISGYTADEIVGSHFSHFYPDDVARARSPAHDLRTKTTTP